MSAELTSIYLTETGLGYPSLAKPSQDQDESRLHRYLAANQGMSISRAQPTIHILDASSYLLQLVERFDALWDSERGRFSEPLQVPEFVKVLKCYNHAFPRIHNPETHFGFIEKRDVDPESKIIVQPDLHGDLKTVIELVKALLEDGLLDKDFKCRPKTLLIFLGDYVDRGYHNLETLAFLYLLKLINRDQVFLLKGNHENVHGSRASIQKYQGTDRQDDNFKMVLETEELCQELAHSYDTMPLTVYSAEKARVREYCHFTHSAFEVTVDPAEMLDSDSDREFMLVSKEFQFSDRMVRMLEKLDALDESKRKAIKVLFELASKESKKEFRTSRELRDKDGIGQIKCAYNWPKINRSSDTLSVATDCDTDQGWQISPEAFRAKQLLSSDKHRVLLTNRGHDHIFFDIVFDGEVIVKTLPVGIDCPISRKGGPMRGTTWIITTAPKLSEWKREVYTREAGTGVTKRHAPQPLRSPQIKGIEENRERKKM